VAHPRLSALRKRRLKMIQRSLMEQAPRQIPSPISLESIKIKKTLWILNTSSRQRKSIDS
jgi:hypothetical protein